MTLLQRTQPGEEQVTCDEQRFISLLGLTLAFSPLFLPSSPLHFLRFFPPSFRSFILISGLSKKLGILRGRPFFLLYFFHLYCIVTYTKWGRNYFFLEFSFRNKRTHFLKKKKKKCWWDFFLSLKNILNLCLEVGTHLDPKSIFSCLLQPYLPLWNSKN